MRGILTTTPSRALDRHSSRTHLAALGGMMQGHRRHSMAVAPDPTTTTFAGFRPEAIQFLAELAEHNSRDWFQPRKGDYERFLKEPMEQLCVALERQFRSRDIPLHADPAKSPFRIYRDVRFSKDKSPYKTAAAASFGWAGDGPDAAAGRSH